MSLIFILFRNQIRNQTPNKISFLFLLLGLTLNLYIYKMMAESFGKDLFAYVVVGEFFINFTISATNSTTIFLRESLIEGVFEQFQLTRSPLIGILKSSYSIFLKDCFINILTIGIAAVFFNLNLGINFVATAIIYTLFCLPFFFSLGILICGIVFFFGKGFSAANQLMFLASVAAGTYFPIKNINEKYIDYLIYLNPYGFYLDSIRTLSENQSINIGSYFGYFATLTFITMPLAFFVFQYSEKKYRKSPIHISTY